ncbi:MAG: acyl-CoA dehydrogenase, partial [Bacillota bacterium]
VTTQGMKVMDMLQDIVAAKGFEQDTYFEMAIRDIGMIPRLEGTTHVNMALVIKFMANYFFDSAGYPEVGIRLDTRDDSNLFRQTTGKLSRVKFPDYREAYRGVDLPNAGVFMEQVELFRKLLATAPPNDEQRKDVDYMLHLGELFTMVVYAQLVLENAKLYKLDDDLINQIFSFLVGDYAQYALAHLSSFVNTRDQEKLLQMMLKKPVQNPAQKDRLWHDQVLSLLGQFKMNE